MQHRNKGKIIGSIYFSLPVYFRTVRKRISNRRSTAFQKLSKTLMLRLLRFSLKRVECEERFFNRENSIDQLSAV